MAVGGAEDPEMVALYYQLRDKTLGSDSGVREELYGSRSGLRETGRVGVTAPSAPSDPGGINGPMMYGFANGDCRSHVVRPSLRSQRELLANQAKNMPRIPGVHFEKKSPAWVANWKENGCKKRIWFRVSEHGMDQAYHCAVAARKTAEGTLPRKDRCARKERRRQVEVDFTEQLKNLPRILGVRFDRFDMAWVASWSEQRKERKKMFSIHLYGFDGARQMAIDHREKKMVQVERDRLLEKGADTPANTTPTPEFGLDYYSNRLPSPSRPTTTEPDWTQQNDPQRSVFYDTVTQSWVTVWSSDRVTRLKRFSTSAMGFEEAYRCATQFRQFPNNQLADEVTVNGPHDQSRPFAQIDDSKANLPLNAPLWNRPERRPLSELSPPPVKVERTDRPAPTPDTLTRDQCRTLILECLNDLRHGVVPLLVQNGQLTPQVTNSVPIDSLLDYHTQAVADSTHEHELRPYLTLFNECLYRKQLPSFSTVEAQRSILHTLSLLMTLTQLLSENADPEKKNTREREPQTPEVKAERSEF